ELGNVQKPPESRRDDGFWDVVSSKFKAYSGVLQGELSVQRQILCCHMLVIFERGRCF
ncbi:hypothetical protein MKW92_025737, partial [Papaver armeniacum]